MFYKISYILLEVAKVWRLYQYHYIFLDCKQNSRFCESSTRNTQIILNISTRFKKSCDPQENNRYGEEEVWTTARFMILSLFFCHIGGEFATQFYTQQDKP